VPAKAEPLYGSMQETCQRVEGRGRTGKKVARQVHSDGSPEIQYHALVARGKHYIEGEEMP